MIKNSIPNAFEETSSDIKTNIIENNPPKIKRRISRKTNLKIFVTIGILAIAGGMGGVIYSIVSRSSYHVQDPWANTILLDNRITRMINQQLSLDLTNPITGLPIKENLKSYVSINVSEKDGIDTYSNHAASEPIRSFFTKHNWITNNMSIVEEMLEGTGAELTAQGQIIFKRNLLNLVLLPKILTYPYNNGDDKYGLVTVNVVDKQRGLFNYKVRFALELVATDDAGYLVSLKKTFDYTYDTMQSATPSDLTLSQMLNLMVNKEAMDFVNVTALQLDTPNDLLLDNLLAYYYPIRRTDSTIEIKEEIKNIAGISFAPIIGDASAKDLQLNVKYNAKSFNNLNQFGMELFNNHLPGYSTMSTIVQNIGIKMPTFENVKLGYDLYERVGLNFSDDMMTNNRINSYQGYIKELGIGTDNISDEPHYIWGSQHQIFRNSVLIKFLNVNDPNLPDNIVRNPTEIFYDQQSHDFRSVAFGEYNILNDLEDVINGINYAKAKDPGANQLIDQELSAQIPQVENSIKKYIMDKLNTPEINENTIIKGVHIGTIQNADIISGSQAQRQAPVNGTGRGDYNKVYLDYIVKLPTIRVVVDFSVDGTNQNIVSILFDFPLQPKNVTDPSGVLKNDIAVLQGNVNPTGTYTTLDNVSFLQQEFKRDVLLEANAWEMQNPNGVNGEYPVNSSMDSDFNVTLVAIRPGRTNNNNLRFGSYVAKLAPSKESLNYRGETTTTTEIIVRKASIAAIAPRNIVIDTSATEKDLYQMIQRMVVENAKSRGLNFTNQDFTISGIPIGTEKLTTIPRKITLEATTGENVVEGKTEFTVTPIPIQLNNFSSAITPRSATVGTNSQITYDYVQKAFNDAIKSAGYPAGSYITINVYDPNGRVIQSGQNYILIGEHSIEILVSQNGGQYFSGTIFKTFLVNQNRK